jgi:amino acid transporter
VVSLFARFRRARGDERQQIKWFAYAAALTLFWTFLVEGPPDSSRVFEAVTAVVGVFVIPSIPIAAGVAIFRYRLYDIDRIINRTLVYAALTGVLMAVYGGGVVLLQTLFRSLTGGESTLAIVASTLAIAALFNPLRRGIQDFIDRRFYRRKYDARETLAAFSARLRDETDLETLTGDLVTVVGKTVQPAHVSLWTRPASGVRKEPPR